MRKPTAKQPKKGAGRTAKKPAKAIQPKKPKKAAKPARRVSHKKPTKAKGHHPVHHKLTRFGRRSTPSPATTPAAFVDLSADPAMPPITDQGDGSCIAHATLALYEWASAKGMDITPTMISAGGVQASLTAGRPVAAGLLVFEGFTRDEATRSGVVPAPSRRDRYIDGHYLLIVGIGYGSEWAAQFPDADPATRYVKVRNSWGTDVYQAGYLLLPLEYLEHYATELWTV